MKVEELIKERESETVEFKENFGKDVIETAVAMANTRGGYIIVGVDNSGRVKGVTLAPETMKNWYNELMQNIEPKVNISLRSEKLKNKDIVIITVPEAPIKPLSYKGRCYKRFLNSNRVMTPNEIAELHNLSTGISWDAFECDITIEDLDRTKVETYMRFANSTGRRNFREDWITVLKKLGLVKDKPTWAALLLFGKEPQKPLLQSAVHCGRFKKNKTTILDDLMIETDLIHAVDEVMKFITRHISVKYEFTGEPRRKEIWEYPLEALREAVINAIVHRDYTIPANVQVEIYDDRIEIWSPGKLPPGISIEDLYREEHRSVIRNKLIAQVFYDIGYIEKYGTGTVKIIELCKAHELPMPEFKEVSGGFAVIFRKDIYTEEYLRNLRLNDRQIRAVMYVKEKGKITNKEYQTLNGVSERTATRDLSKLVSLNIFEQIGSTGKGTFYLLRNHKEAKDAIKEPKRRQVITGQFRGVPQQSLIIRYYCRDSNFKIKELLEVIKKRHGIAFEIIQNKPFKEEKDKIVYEKDLKPRSKILKKRTGKSITELRAKGGHYFVSIPGTIILYKNNIAEWWELATEEGLKFLKRIADEGMRYLDKLIK